MVCGVDVRGGAPGSRETDLLAPGAAVVERVHALVLTGGSAYGLAAADGVMAALADRGIGFRVGPEPEWWCRSCRQRSSSTWAAAATSPAGPTRRSVGRRW